MGLTGQVACGALVVAYTAMMGSLLADGYGLADMVLGAVVLVLTVGLTALTELIA